MRVGRMRRLSALLLAALMVVGCGAQAPSDQPAVEVLVRSYDAGSGVWPTTGWWNSANALNALTTYMIISGDHRYGWVVENTFTSAEFANLASLVALKEKQGVRISVALPTLNEEGVAQRFILERMKGDISLEAIEKEPKAKLP